MSPGILVTRKLSVTFLPCSAINNSSLRSRLRHVPKSVASDTESERERKQKLEEKCSAPLGNERDGPGIEISGRKECRTTGDAGEKMRARVNELR